MLDGRGARTAPSPNGQANHSDATRAWAERWLSAERLAPYLADCNGNVDRALELYEWNVRLGQVLIRDISHFEVALRNAYDRVMNEAWEGCWLLDDTSSARTPVMRKSKRRTLDANRINRKTIDAVVDRLPPDASTGAIVANLTLGFWVHLSDRSREAAIWRTAALPQLAEGHRSPEAAAAA